MWGSVKISVVLRFDMSDFEKRLNEYGLGLTDTVINAFVGAGIIDLFILSQEDVPERSGFLKSTGKAELIAARNTGVVSYSAPYAEAVHNGYLTKSGKHVKGRKYLYPKNAETAFHDMITDMSKFYSDLARGITTASSIPKVTLPKTGPAARGRRQPSMIHRFTAARITATGKKSFLFRGPKGRFTKVFKPGLGKAQRQAGRKRRIGSRQ
jgi:hypothetical protein